MTIIWLQLRTELTSPFNETASKRHRFTLFFFVSNMQVEQKYKFKTPTSYRYFNRVFPRPTQSLQLTLASPVLHTLQKFKKNSFEVAKERKKRTTWGLNVHSVPSLISSAMARTVMWAQEHLHVISCRSEKKSHLFLKVVVGCFWCKVHPTNGHNKV